MYDFGDFKWLGKTFSIDPKHQQGMALNKSFVPGTTSTNFNQNVAQTIKPDFCNIKNASKSMTGNSAIKI